MAPGTANQLQCSMDNCAWHASIVIAVTGCQLCSSTCLRLNVPLAHCRENQHRSRHANPMQCWPLSPDQPDPCTAAPNSPQHLQAGSVLQDGAAAGTDLDLALCNSQRVLLCCLVELGLHETLQALLRSFLARASCWWRRCLRGTRAQLDRHGG